MTAGQRRAHIMLDGGYLVPGLVDAPAQLALYSPAGDEQPVGDQIRVPTLLIREPILAS